MKQDEDQETVAALLASMPPPDVPADFVARVNARIDGTEGWLGVADFRLWTLRLAPAAALFALIIVLWPGASTETTISTGSTAAADSFRPGSVADWQQEVSSDALLVAALTGGANAR